MLMVGGVRDKLVLTGLRGGVRTSARCEGSDACRSHADLFDEDLDEVADRLNDAIRASADGRSS